ncbi:multidrug effflux MFS transporter [Rhizobium sp. P38BS-XIX]|uniref:MFS transporter n=1 Tax=Rhizobium sp. P38BS-XIX TaxID=2726740 RepID=UPI0014577497|nr:MFS transporter [Rhizobium sp. P38BS-XIX]NLR98077.1 multidrug effflux MFS transporter [Rhizobium sp. P38BS-XIX]
MGLSSIALDIMLAALPDIGRAMRSTAPNLAQWTVGIFLAGAAVSAFLIGPVADAYGRRLPILAGLTLFVVASLIVPFAQSMEMMLALRLMQGIGVGTTRLSQAMLRDHYSGSEMAEAMSLSLVAFLILPVLAPLIGQGILMVGGWRAIFLTMASLGLAVLVWAWCRLPETLASENRRPLSLSSIRAGLAIITHDRNAIGYGLAAMFLLGGLYGFIATAQPIYGEAFGLGGYFAFAMAATAIVQSGAAFVCSLVIRRHGAQVIGLIAVSAYVGIAAAMVLMLTMGMLSFWLFLVLITAMMAMFTWADATLGAISMKNLGRVAGTAASAFGAIQALGATLLGSLIGQSYDGTPGSLIWGSLILGILSLLAVVWARRAPSGGLRSVTSA